MPDAPPQYYEVRALRELVGAILITGLQVWLLSYGICVAILTSREMQFPASSMNLPVRQRIQAIEKSSTIWFCAAIFFAAITFQLVTMWRSWYSLNRILMDGARGFT